MGVYVTTTDVLRRLPSGFTAFSDVAPVTVPTLAQANAEIEDIEAWWHGGIAQAGFVVPLAGACVTQIRHALSQVAAGRILRKGAARVGGVGQTVDQLALSLIEQGERDAILLVDQPQRLIGVGVTSSYGLTHVGWDGADRGTDSYQTTDVTDPVDTRTDAERNPGPQIVADGVG